LATDLLALINGTRTGLLSSDQFGPSSDTQESGSRPYTTQQILNAFDDCNGTLCIFTPCNGCSDACCETGPYVGLGLPDRATETACAVFVEPCQWSVGSVYIVVEALTQFQQTVPITYSLIANEYRAPLQLTPNEFVAAQATNNNWEYQFYQIQQPTVTSLRVRVQVAAGTGVLVTLTDASCSSNVTYTQQTWCEYQQPNVPFACDIDIPTRASHPGAGHTNFYISVYGANATYAITYYEGRENCHKIPRTRHQ